MDNLPFKTRSTLIPINDRYDFECRPWGERIFIGDIFGDDRALTVDVLKRIEKQIALRTYVMISDNVERMVDALSRVKTKSDIWAGVYARTQAEAYANIPTLVNGNIPARCFAVCSPLLEKVVVYQWLNKYKKSLVKENDFNGISWVVVSGDDSVVMKKEWLLDMFIQCASANVAMYFKGWGAAERSGEEIPTEKEKALFERVKFLSPEYARDFRKYYDKNSIRRKYGKRYIKTARGVSSPKR